MRISNKTKSRLLNTVMPLVYRSDSTSELATNVCQNALDFAGNHDIIKESNMDAGQRLAFGLCKKYGIELPKGAGPKEAWEALKEKTGKGPMDFYGQSGNEGADKVKFSTASPKLFAKKLNQAKASQNPRNAWRVTGMNKAQLLENHPNAKIHVTDGGSTIAVDNGDIVGVCVGAGDGPNGLLSGSSILAYAVKNGGKKLDSYEGNHRFYAKNGFEPVSWCEWDSAYEGDARKQGWDPDQGDKREAIVFYKYVGKGNVKYGADDLERFKSEVPASKDYGMAQSARDREIR